MLIGNMSRKNVFQYLMIDRGEELSDITFQDPTCTRVIVGYFVRKRAKPIHRLVRPLSDTTGERVGDKYSVEERIELAMKRMMQEPVAHACFMYVARLRIGYLERLVAAMTISAIHEVTMERKDVVHQTRSEFLHIWLFTLAAQEFLPSLKQILD
jgi:hypothetical protein